MAFFSPLAKPLQSVFLGGRERPRVGFLARCGPRTPTTRISRTRRASLLRANGLGTRCRIEPLGHRSLLSFCHFTPKPKERWRIARQADEFIEVGTSRATHQSSPLPQ